MMELDPILKNGLKLLHSNDNTSAEKLRLAIDDIISQKYGPTKLLSSILSKKYLNEESNAVGSNLVAVKRPKIEKKPRTSEVEALEPVDAVEDDDHLKELEDLFCKNCKRMDVSARNRLVECSDCHSLYHQECHQPPISETDANDQENSWYCFTCKEKASSISKASSTNSSPAKSSSSSSTSSSYTNKNYESSSSSSKKSKDKTANSASSTTAATIATTTANAAAANSNVATPSINIVSADKRIQNMKKKAAQRKHK